MQKRVFDPHKKKMFINNSLNLIGENGDWYQNVHGQTSPRVLGALIAECDRKDRGKNYKFLEQMSHMLLLTSYDSIGSIANLIPMCNHFISFHFRRLINLFARWIDSEQWWLMTFIFKYFIFEFIFVNFFPVILISAYGVRRK